MAMFFSPEGVNLGMGINENKPEETSKKEPWTIGYSMGSMDQWTTENSCVDLNCVDITTTSFVRDEKVNTFGRIMSDIYGD